MSYSYDSKIIISGKEIEFYKYKKRIWRDFKNNKEFVVRKMKQLNILSLMRKKRNRKKSKSSISRTKTLIRRIINSNSQLNKFLTLTFAENITDIKKANYLFNQFIKRVYYRFSDFEYLAVIEFQKRGAVHYHLLCNLPFVDVKEFAQIWKHGFIKLRRTDKVKNMGAYLSKYLGKEVNEKTFRKKKYFCSQNLKQPVELIGWKATKFSRENLSSLEPVYKKNFSSKWTDEIEYRAYSLSDFPDFNNYFIFPTDEWTK